VQRLKASGALEACERRELGLHRTLLPPVEPLPSVRLLEYGFISCGFAQPGSPCVTSPMASRRFLWPSTAQPAIAYFVLNVAYLAKGCVFLHNNRCHIQYSKLSKFASNHQTSNTSIVSYRFPTCIRFPSLHNHLRRHPRSLRRSGGFTTSKSASSSLSQHSLIVISECSSPLYRLSNAFSISRVLSVVNVHDLQSNIHAVNLKFEYSGGHSRDP
jgi:hypothetical protein